MSGLLDPREVLSYLNERGYTHITAQQLKCFMKGTFATFFCCKFRCSLPVFFLDLKKLIKYDLRRQNHQIKTPLTENLSELSKFAQIDSYLYSTPSVTTPKHKNKLAQVESYLHSTTTTTSALSSKPKTKENVITVEVKRPRQNKSTQQPTGSGEVNKEIVGEEVVRSKIGKSKSTGKILGKSQATLKPGASCNDKRKLLLEKLFSKCPLNICFIS